MGRLIDVDKVTEHLEEVKKRSVSLADIAHVIGCQSVIEAQPTAYNPDKVIEQLEKQMQIFEPLKSEDRYLDGMATAFRIAIEIVKAGGEFGR